MSLRLPFFALKWMKLDSCPILQVCLEGQISKDSVLKSLSDGYQPSGDQIPWKVSEQFQDTNFPSLSGARIVRIAVHPNVIRVFLIAPTHWNLVFDILSNGMFFPSCI